MGFPVSLPLHFSLYAIYLWDTGYWIHRHARTHAHTLTHTHWKQNLSFTSLLHCWIFARRSWLRTGAVRLCAAVKASQTNSLPAQLKVPRADSPTRCYWALEGPRNGICKHPRLHPVHPGRGPLDHASALMEWERADPSTSTETMSKAKWRGEWALKGYDRNSAAE